MELYVTAHARHRWAERFASFALDLEEEYRTARPMTRSDQRRICAEGRHRYMRPTEGVRYALNKRGIVFVLGDCDRIVTVFWASSTAAARSHLSAKERDRMQRRHGACR